MSSTHLRWNTKYFRILSQRWGPKAEISGTIYDIVTCIYHLYRDSYPIISTRGSFPEPGNVSFFFGLLTHMSLTLVKPRATTELHLPAVRYALLRKGWEFLTATPVSGCKFKLHSGTLGLDLFTCSAWPTVRTSIHMQDLGNLYHSSGEQMDHRLDE